MWNVAQQSVAEELAPPAYYRDLISEMYDSSWYGGLGSGELTYYANLMGGERALEFPVGTGRLAIPLLEAGLDVYGLDNSPDMLSQLIDKLAEREMLAEKHRFILWDGLNTPYPCAAGSFGVATIPFASFSLMHSNHRGHVAENRVLRELNRIVRDGGTVVINDYRTAPIDRSKLDSQQVFNHRHIHSVHGEILEEQKSVLRVEPNDLVPNQVIRYRKSRLIRTSDDVVLRECEEVTPIWDGESFPALGADAGFDYVGGDVVDFHTDETINHVFVKRSGR